MVMWPSFQHLRRQIEDILESAEDVEYRTEGDDGRKEEKIVMSYGVHVVWTSALNDLTLIEKVNDFSWSLAFTEVMAMACTTAWPYIAAA